MYCANAAGFLPSEPVQVARTVEVMNTLEDVRFASCCFCCLTRADQRACV
jgi:hypothetical protein